ncbi:fumarylacetoacetase [Bacillus canaveralius]|uniref:Fumarylacetoacetase n=1 Tax=Bacillus canaveralius TaxID=1403243 RepID=A0A2N5GLL0_9BACI|nr:fumarylacetoacetate hydrolase family protein [Bacillus canaveralius]PLR82479.1 fumarylacetoacetase [Bacillus canaveralius]PLR95650.1 fumarylacetoacetase [Bacillus canaveralius]
MKFVTFKKKDGAVGAGWLQGEDLVVDMHEVSNGVLPNNMLDFIQDHSLFMDHVRSLPSFTKTDWGTYPLGEVALKAPLPNPRSVRDFYAFEDHVKNARHNRGLEMIPEWYEIPVFYFSNHLAVIGPDEPVHKPAKCQWLDYELEIACVIGTGGKNIKPEEAEEHIFGYCIMNDWSARDLQRQEMKVGLGPAKGKDFATSLGPYIVTRDELEPYRLAKNYNLKMKATVNGRELSKGNMKELYFSFPELIHRASDSVALYAGEVIGSGTVGSGCLLELGQEVHRWLEPGDEVALEITGLGVLRNIIADQGEMDDNVLP